MKLLGWIHRKFRQNNGDTGRDLATVSYCLHCVSGIPSPDHLLPNPPPPIHRKALLPAETEPTELTASFLADGLLHIGTFGSPILIPENERPATIANEIAEKEMEMPTESELIAISVELEKVIAEESEKEKKSGERLSTASARPSCAESFGGKVSDVCPLQDFLFGSTVEAVEKRRRGSLGELFMRSRAAEEGGGGGAKRKGILIADEDAVKRTPAREKMSVEMKGMLKCGGEAISNGGSCGTETKIQNIWRTFRRKIHPENSIGSKKLAKHAKYEINGDHNCPKVNKISRNSINDNGRRQAFNSPKIAEERSSSASFKKPRSIVKNNSTGSREQWIKTDADYLVLEL